MKREGVRANSLHFIGDLHVSGAFLLSDCILLKHWWLALIGGHSNVFMWILILEQRAQVFMEILLTTAYIWFRRPKKPPNIHSWKRRTSEILDNSAFVIEDLIACILNKDVDLCYWLYIIWFMIKDLIKDIIPITMPIFDNQNEISKEEKGYLKWKRSYSQEVEIIEMNTKDKNRFRHGRKINSNLVMSLSTKASNGINDIINVDTDSYTAAIDTCTSESIFKHKELFVGKIKSSNNIFVQGVGGKIKASGYGTVKLRISDDEGKPYDLLIHNVIYLPNSPINLISPQRWSKDTGNPHGTGEITVGGNTLLFWNDHKASKLIPHHPEMGIPIMTFNDGYTKSSAFLELSKFALLCQSCNTDTFAYAQTSQTIEDPTNPSQVHIIPIDDEDSSIHCIPSQNRNKTGPAIIMDDTDTEILSDNAIENMEVIQHERLDQLDDHDDLIFDLNDDDTVLDSSNDSVDTSWTNENEQVIDVPVNEIDELVASVDSKTSEKQKELLAHHYRLKHLPFSYLKRLAKKGIIPKYLQNVNAPLCYPCMMGKQHKKPWRGKNKKHLHHIRKAKDNFTGANTSTDQMISPFGGLIPQMKGRLMRAKYYAATIFVDHHSDYTYVHLMQDTTAVATLEAKNAYERLIGTFGSKVLAYHADNGRFAEKAYMSDVKDKGQNITFCGVGSHHQNGIAERRIRSLGEDARTMLAHGEHLWPEVVNKTLWPFAYKAAARSRNKFNLDAKGLSPEEKASGVIARSDFKNEHALFCPVFTLHKRLQGGIGGIPKWNPRSNAGVYLGHSPDHAGNVALVLSLSTGLVSPQYHVVFDDSFSSVPFIRSKEEPSNWESLCKYHTEDFRMHALPTTETTIDLQNLYETHHPTPTTNTPPPTVPLNVQNQRGVDTGQSVQPQDGPEEIFEDALDEPYDDTLDFDIQDDTLVPEGARTDDENDNDQLDDENIRAPEGVSREEPPLRRSTRIRHGVDRLTSSKLGNLASESLINALTILSSYLSTVSKPPSEYIYSAFKTRLVKATQSHPERSMYYDMAVQLNVDGSLNHIHPLSFATQTTNNEAYHFHQAMQQHDREEFLQAMMDEIKAHEDNNHWALVLRSEINNAPTIKAIWSFKRKRRPDGSLIKHKARLCAHGGMQIHGVNYWDTYAPVVNWLSIRMMLTLSVIHQLYTTSIDFTLAFPQAEADVEIYMELPLGCEISEGGDYVCLLLKNLYGTKQAAKTWFEYLRDALMLPESEGGHGFKQSKIDPCIFYKDGVTVITWVDDCLIFTRQKFLADELIVNLKKKFTLSEEDDVSAYLGVKMDINEESGKVTMSQPFLTDRIIELLGDSVKDANVKDTPAVYKEILHKDELGPERKQSWKYRSAIGMLNYLAATTRPDILYAVHQCARFSANPRLSHERAVKRIVRYLKKTRDKGIIMTPNKEKGIQCFVDADFAGGFSSETSEDPVSVFSRTGYVIYYYGCPLIWVSKLQSEISLSTVEAEYIALSQSMRDVIPLIDQITEMDGIFNDSSPKPILHCKLFEDNNGALELAKSPRYRPRTKHIAIKYHHFREHVKLGKVSINAIDTSEQIADIFTKGLPSISFAYLRYKLLGW